MLSIFILFRRSVRLCIWLAISLMDRELLSASSLILLQHLLKSPVLTHRQFSPAHSILSPLKRPPPEGGRDAKMLPLSEYCMVGEPAEIVPDFDSKPVALV